MALFGLGKLVCLKMCLQKDLSLVVKYQLQKLLITISEVFELKLGIKDHTSSPKAISRRKCMSNPFVCLFPPLSLALSFDTRTKQGGSMEPDDSLQ